MAGGESSTSSDAEYTLRNLVTSDEVREIHATIDTQWGPLLQSSRQTAAVRALWSHVINDPLADIFAGERLLRGLHATMRRERLNNAKEIPGVMMAIRTLWFDARLEAAIEAFGHTGTQIVLLGAGMDARAYRLSCLRKCTVFELDFPELLELKSNLINQEKATSTNNNTKLNLQSNRLIQVTADLRESDWYPKLTNSGFSPETNTIWLLEGILYYLSENHAMQVLETIATTSKSTMCTALLADFMNKSAITLSDNLYHFYCDWPEQLLPSIGFHGVNITEIGDLDANFGLLSDPENLFERRRKIPRSVEMDPIDGSPCCRLYLVEAAGPGRLTY